jgi:quinol monooxygenase YgiN
MFARSTTIHGEPGAIETGITFIRDEVMPAITAMDGCIGMSLLVDRESGRCIATSSWRDEASMRATDEALSAFRTRGGEILGGAPQVEEWEVAVMHRDHASQEGACCRVTWARSTDLDATLEMWRTRVLGRIEQMPGFCSASLLVDRARGITCGTATFDSHEALAATRESAREIRDMAARELGVEFLDVAELDLALAHLRLPELV